MVLRLGGKIRNLFSSSPEDDQVNKYAGDRQVPSEDNDTDTDTTVNDVFKGLWSGATAYIVGDLARNLSGALYICTTNNTNQEPPNASYWTLMSSDVDTDTDTRVNDDFKGLWSGATAYTVGDLTRNLSGALYICTTNNTNQEPPDASYWTLMSSDVDTQPNPVQVTYEISDIYETEIEDDSSGGTWTDQISIPITLQEDSFPLMLELRADMKKTEGGSSAQIQAVLSDGEEEEELGSMLSSSTSYVSRVSDEVCGSNVSKVFAGPSGGFLVTIQTKGGASGAAVYFKNIKTSVMFLENVSTVTEGANWGSWS